MSLIIMRNIYGINKALGWIPFTLQVADLTVTYSLRDASEPKGRRQDFNQEAEKLEDHRREWVDIRVGGWVFQTRMGTQRLAVDKWRQSIAFNGHNPKSSDSFTRVFSLLQ